MIMQEPKGRPASDTETETSDISQLSEPAVRDDETEDGEPILDEEDLEENDLTEEDLADIEWEEPKAEDE